MILCEIIVTFHIDLGTSNVKFGRIPTLPLQDVNSCLMIFDHHCF